jgi:hypothetical protein
MKLAVVLLFSTLAISQTSKIRKEHWGMTQSEVIKAEKAAPLKRTQASLMYRDKEFDIPAQVLFEFTDGKLDDISYVADAPSQNPELVFLTWCLELTKQYGQGVVYLNKKPVGRPGLMLDESLKQFWKQTEGEILVVYEPQGITNVGVGITLINGSPIVELDYAATPKNHL